MEAKIQAATIKLFLPTGEATGQRSTNGFVVFKGSQAVAKDTPAIPDIVKQVRSLLISKNILVLADGAYQFAYDYEFNSPSLAAGILVAGSASGPKEWKNKAGKSLKEIEA